MRYHIVKLHKEICIMNTRLYMLYMKIIKLELVVFLRIVSTEYIIYGITVIHC